jgi:hypothetical protein
METVMITDIRKSNTRRSTLSVRTAILNGAWAADPDMLKRVVQEAVSSLTEEQRAAYGRRLIRTLFELGLNVRAILFVSGVVEQDPADLTPSEIAHLFRYIRINVPWVLTEANDLFAGLEQKRETRKAA